MQSLELAVPGTYIAGEPLVRIQSFAPQLHVISSKQRPRKLTILGSDGANYMFLLKVGRLSPALSGICGGVLCLYLLPCVTARTRVCHGPLPMLLPPVK